jgi:hypothetical protein
MKPYLLAVALTMTVGSLMAQDVDYSRDIKPLLIEKCSSCHGALRQETGLRLDAGKLLHQESATYLFPGTSIRGYKSSEHRPER